ncbi:methyl-accepting chemotaxis protein [Treponema putidum]|uniref:Methyl-accepting chemotaxis protein n=1 Tax=Treponema putidum TaxID=221027 RepID=A0AAE9SKR7_9SPIR|nr:methyl-accepting chemotaxis protein [Treponema putidum]UTY32129.1 methyl-accepting chemotaxis protein [Treponema putidum]UTY34517.1 methyl-accepting chemotaxis protein [Treponema putidum]
MSKTKRFSLFSKFMAIFGLLILIISIILSFFSIRIARKAVIEKVETHLIDKAADTAEIVDGRISIFFQVLEDIAQEPILKDPAVSYQEKTKYLEKAVSSNEKIEQLNLYGLSGVRTTNDGTIVDVHDREWFKSASAGNKFISEPLLSRSLNKFTIILALPLYDNNHNMLGVLNCVVDAKHLSNLISDIVVGKTGYCFIIGSTGTIVALQDFDKVTNMVNILKMSETDKSLESLASFEKTALENNTSSVGFYEYEGVSKIASYATMKTTNWKVIINAPVNEFMKTVNSLRLSLMGLTAIILVGAFILIYFDTRYIIKPIKKVVNALKNIAHGEGDLTVRLPINGNDEITDLSEYFNQTISKIGSSIKTVGASSEEMTSIGSELASNMTETASAVHQISANIDGVKQQALTQAASVTETAATIEEIIRTIKQLNGSIENQAASVAESSSAIEQMVGNIASITQTLGKTDDVIKTLASATADGKETIVNSNSVTQKIAEESGSLLEASSVIQHIASQTNLLAMNAAIEAAHAGEAGKGFAVVADEIRKLAEESSTQGKTITSTLKVLSGEIEALSTSSKTAEERFNTIFALSEQVKTMSQNLTNAMREQENGSKEVLTAIRDINMVTNQVNDGSAEMLRGGENVAQEMQKLDELTRVITDSMNEMAIGARQINNAVQEVNEISQKNKHSIENLANEVKKFKV